MNTKLIGWRAIRFLAAGVIITVVDYGTFRLVISLGVEPSWARLPSFIVAFAASFLIHQAWTFESNRPWANTLVQYLPTRLLTMLLSQAVFMVAHDYFGLGPDLSFWLQAPIQPALNFLFGYFIVFRRHP